MRPTLRAVASEPLQGQSHHGHIDDRPAPHLVRIKEAFRTRTHRPSSICCATLRLDNLRLVGALFFFFFFSCCTAAAAPTLVVLNLGRRSCSPLVHPCHHYRLSFTTWFSFLFSLFADADAMGSWFSACRSE
ncbi:uncharacterized protein P884DRAFT_10373 [Thermothelomyces heterothallicus CBS 202.75]|uniref:uncharacterized protein n=1 Tax=Thermothelomyces heterothallicus CBS 202.75 TaxID=1149848 RepID=UPI0037445B13